jgi:Na+-transporting NADH:ubiquinone oxidoreductase subunit B
MTTFIHSGWRVETILRWFILASIPAALVGAWNLGDQTLDALTAGVLPAPSDWRTALVPSSPSDSALPWRALLLGLSYMVPLLVVSLAASRICAEVFARVRGRAVDPGWLMSGWLFVLLLPPSVTLPVAAIGMSFGAIVGAQIFGGTGRYLISPALLGVLFIHFSFPEFAASGLPVEGSDVGGDWAMVAAREAGPFTNHLIGTIPGSIGGTSALACLAGLALLLAVGAAPWRIVAGAVLGSVVASILLGASVDEPFAELPWYWHLAAGNFAFAVSFLATDPSTGPLTRASRWLYGGAIGLLTVAIRVLDPSHPEGTLFAILLAGLALPVIDFWVMRRYRLGASS